MAPAELTALVLIAWPLAPPERQALLDACTRAFSQGSCVEMLDEGELALPSARVDESSAHEVKITIRVAQEETAERQRQLSFAPADTELERARAVGFTMGVLLGELVEQQPAEEPAPEVEAVDPLDMSLRPPIQRAPAPRFRLQAQLGTGWDNGLRALEFGAALRGGWRPEKDPWWLGVALDTWSPGELDGVRVRKTHGSLWAGWSIKSGDFELGAALDVGVQWLHAAAEVGLESDQDTRWVPFLRASGSVVRWLGPRWGLVVSTQAGWVTSTTELFVQNEATLSTGHLNLSLLVGPTFRWAM